MILTQAAGIFKKRVSHNHLERNVFYLAIKRDMDEKSFFPVHALDLQMLSLVPREVHEVPEPVR